MTSDNRHQISIIMPVYNGERYLAQAIESIRSQRVAPLELIVIDDGSTDRTRAIVEAFGAECRYHYQKNAGPAAARNTGIEMARGGIVGFLDADDLLAPGGLSVRYARLTDSARLDAVMGCVQVLERQGEEGGFEANGAPLISYNLGSVLARRTVFERVGTFDVRYRYCEDVDWFMRAQEHGTVFDVLSDAVLLYRRHERNMSRDGAGLASDLVKVLKASVDRRRRLPGAQAVPLDEIYYLRPGRVRIQP